MDEEAEAQRGWVNGPMSHSDLVTLQIPEPGGLCGMVVPRTSLAVP